MGEYQQSVKSTLTRRLIFIIICSVFIIYALVITVQTIQSKSQSE